MLNEEQLHSAHYSGPSRNLLTLASPGSGKTRVIMARTEFLLNNDAEPEDILMLTFTNKAAKEMKSRLYQQVGSRAERITAGTFHSVCLELMSSAPEFFGLKVKPRIVDADDQRNIMNRVRGVVIEKGEKDFPKANKLLEYYSYARNSCIAHSEYLKKFAHLSDRDMKKALKIFVDYQQYKEERGMFDFDDLLIHFVNVLDNNEDVRAKIQNLFMFIMVDEYQDTNPIQQRLLQLMVGKYVHLFAVGDVRQSIYRFRGADVEGSLNFTDLFEESEVLSLSTNYRSTQSIIDVSNWLIGRSDIDYGDKMICGRQEQGDKPEFVTFTSPGQEAAWVVDKITDKKDEGLKYSDIMIVVRSAMGARAMESALAKAEIPYQFFGGMSMLKAAHVRDALCAARVLVYPDDELAWVRLFMHLPKVGDKTAVKYTNRILEVLKARGTTEDVHEELCSILGKEHPYSSLYAAAMEANSIDSKVRIITARVGDVIKTNYDNWELRQKDLKLLNDVSEQFESLAQLIEAFTLDPMTNKEIENNDTDALRVTTVHSAKGLEAKVVFMIQAGVGQYPHMRSIGDVLDEREERRVAFVAVTRAMDELYITRSETDQYGGAVFPTAARQEGYFFESLCEPIVKMSQKGLGGGMGLGARLNRLRSGSAEPRRIWTPKGL